MVVRSPLLPVTSSDSSVRALRCDEDAIVSLTRMRCVGVGFYSVFMVANRVEVFSKSAAHPEQPAHYWTSDGSGNFEMGEADGVSRGTKVVGKLPRFTPLCLLCFFLPYFWARCIAAFDACSVCIHIICHSI